MREIEIKVRVTDVDAFKQKLADHKIELGQPVTQKDVVYGVREGDGWVHGQQWFRLRAENDSKHIFTMKRTAGPGLDSIEYETTVEDPEAIENILADLGFEHYCTITKVRAKGHYQDLEICLDHVPELGGDFFEVEKMIPVDASSDGVLTELREFLKALGCTESDEIDKGYDVLLLEQQDKPV